MKQTIRNFRWKRTNILWMLGLMVIAVAAGCSQPAPVPAPAPGLGYGMVSCGSVAATHYGTLRSNYSQGGLNLQLSTLSSQVGDSSVNGNAVLSADDLNVLYPGTNQPNTFCFSTTYNGSNFPGSVQGGSYLNILMKGATSLNPINNYGYGGYYGGGYGYGYGTPTITPQGGAPMQQNIQLAVQAYLYNNRVTYGYARMTIGTLTLDYYIQ